MEAPVWVIAHETSRSRRGDVMEDTGAVDCYKNRYIKHEQDPKFHFRPALGERDSRRRGYLPSDRL